MKNATRIFIRSWLEIRGWTYARVSPDEQKRIDARRALPRARRRVLALMRMTLIRVGGLTIVLQVACTGTAKAAAPTTSFTVLMTIQATCSIATSDLQFPQYTGAVDTATTTLTITCTDTTTYNVGLDAGSSGGTVALRKMKNGSNTLGYKLFSNSSYTTIWGQTVGTDTVAGVGTGTAQILTVYGQVPAAETGAPFTYTDTITATVTY